jgi:hypothetical protein
MTKEDYLKQVEKEKINLDELGIMIGRISSIPFTTGCYVDGEVWVIYKTGERQNVVVVKEGSENEIFETMYRLTKGMEKQRIY